MFVVGIFGQAIDTLGIRLPVDFVIFYQIAQSTSGTKSYSEDFTLIAKGLHEIVSHVEMNGNSPTVHSDLAGNPCKQVRDCRCSSPYLSTCLYTNRSDAIHVIQKPEEENKRARQPKIPMPLILMHDT